jgi:hypothetical protein
VRAEPEREYEQPGEAGPIVAAGSALREGLPLVSHRPHPIAPAGALIPPFGSDAVAWTTGTPSYPGDQAVELLAWMAQALIAAPRRLGDTPDDASPDGPRRMAARPMACPAGATHTGSPRRPGQATTRIPAGKCAPPPTSPLNT